MPELSIRTASANDAQAIANFHVKVWRHTYRDLAPREAFDVLDEQRRGTQWTERLSSNDTSQVVLIAEISGRMVGIGSAGRPSEMLFGERGEISFLYVDPDLKRSGVGRALLSTLATHLKGLAEYRGAALSVVKGNEPAIAYYEALKGRRAGEYVDSGPTWRSHNIVFVWDDVAGLIAS